MPNVRKNNRELSVAVVGGGVCGLAAALRLSKLGIKVTLFEKDMEVGGLASSFKIGNHPIEKFYHHIFQSDTHLIRLIHELSLQKSLRFTTPKNAIYYQGVIHPFTIALDLLKFKPLTLRNRLIVGYKTLYLKKTKWQNLQKYSASEWLKLHFGPQVYKVIWEPLLAGKFDEYRDVVSMPWFWARIVSRTSKLGYLENGFNELFDNIVEFIEKNNGLVRTGEKVNRLMTTKHGVSLSIKGNRSQFDAALVTCAPAIFSKMLGQNNGEGYEKQYLSQKYIGSICLILELDRPLTDYYWVNINNASCPFIALVEHTNFQSPEKYDNRHIVYLGKYLSTDNKLFTYDKVKLLEQVQPTLKKINPFYKSEWIKKVHLHKELFAQPVVDLNYPQHIPEIGTPFKNIYYASMSQIFPYDRGMNYSVKVAEDAVNLLVGDLYG